MELNKEMLAIRDLFISINDSFFKAFMAGNPDVLDDLYEQSMTHLDLKCFELGVDPKYRSMIKNSLEFLINKHLVIFYRVHNAGEDANDVVPEVLALTFEELKEFGDFIKL
jgi:hypothetical protein